MSILIKNATTLENEKTDVYIEQNRIVEIKKNSNKKADEIIDATNKVVMPGFVNSHTHVAMAIFRGYGEDLPLNKWLTEKIWPAEAKLTEEDVYWGSLLGMCEMIRSGTTTFNEMYIVGMDQIAKACKEIGMRAVIARGTLDRIPGKNFEKEYKDAVDFAKKWKNSELVTPAMSAHSIYATSEEMIIKLKEYAQKEKLKFHMHVSETRKEIFDCLKEHKKYPIEYLGQIGVLDKDTIVAHGSWVTKREIKLCGENNVNIATCPISNLKLATGGICPVHEYHSHGANVCIGTDGAASNNSLNMFESLKMTALLQKHRYWKADIINVGDLINFSTKNGAKALGIDAGEIKEGKLADLILLDSAMANFRPFNDLNQRFKYLKNRENFSNRIKANVVYSANAGNVSDVIVNGKIIMRDRKILTADEQKIIKKCEELF